MISIVFPAYNEEENVEPLHRQIKEAMDKFGEPYEIIAVENGSTDRTLERLENLKPIKIIVIAKNVGQTAGLDAGIRLAKGDIIVTLDADLQNNPADISHLIKKLRDGYDVVSGWRKKRRDSLDRRILSRWANWLTQKVTGLFLHDSACALKAYRKEILKDVHLYGEMHVFLPAYLYLRGARVAELEVDHRERTRGKSKHNFLKAIKDLSDLITIKFLSSSVRPLLFFGMWAIGLWFFGFLSGITAIILKVAGLRDFGQTPLPLLAVLFVIVGLLFFAIGFLAELLLRIYYESKNARPYIIKKIIEK